MINIAIAIIHNKTTNQNVAQINALKNHLAEVRAPLLDDDGLPILDDEGLPLTYFLGYRINALTLDHLIKVYQIIPYGVTPPTNLYSIDSYKVFYGEGDNNKTGTHPRFLNWGMKRGIDHGASVCIYLNDVSSIDFADIKTKIANADNVGDLRIFAEPTCGKIINKRVLRYIGQLDEGRTFNQAITDLKNRVIQGGYQNG